VSLADAFCVILALSAGWKCDASDAPDDCASIGFQSRLGSVGQDSVSKMVAGRATFDVTATISCSEDYWFRPYTRSSFEVASLMSRIYHGVSSARWSPMHEATCSDTFGGV
jgi:hypothetical protein